MIRLIVVVAVALLILPWDQEAFARTLVPSTGQTYYVCASEGDDNNDGLTPATCWATRQHAWVFVQQNLDFGGCPFGSNCVTVQLLDGTYVDETMQGVGSLTGQSFAAAMSFRGNCDNPSKVVIKTPGTAWTADDKAMYALRCMHITTSKAGSVLVGSQHGGSLIVLAGGIVLSGGVETGPMLLAQLSAGIIIGGDVTVMGGGAAFEAAGTGGTVVCLNSCPVSFGEAVNFASGFAVASDLGIIKTTGMSFSGIAVGRKFSVSNNAVIDTGGAGANSLPGSMPGVSHHGGIAQ